VSIKNQDLNQRWDAILSTTLYELTHAMAGLVQQQCLADVQPAVLPGISFRSRLAPADIVYVMYDPPLDPSEWIVVGTPISLAGVDGQQLLRDVLAGLEMVWLNDPTLSAGTPPAGAI